ncbi:MAG: DinB family protein [Acidobacteria bacterium]|nr:DinB family protein [Acidobacteriota bacterium]
MEPWLAGRFAGLSPIPRLLCCSLEQSLADVIRWTDALTDDQVWHEPYEKSSVGFQLRHLAGSVDRLLTYAKEESLSGEQLAFLRTEAEPGASKAALIADLHRSYEAATAFAQPAKDLNAPRFIGRQRLETPLGVLLGHIAEHTQRHTGQLIVLARLVVIAKTAYSSHR